MKYTALVLIMLAGSTLIAGETKVAKYAGEFLSIGVGGRALGMGRTAVALASDVTAGYWNPAGLVNIRYPEVTFMHDEGFGNLISYDYGAVAIPYGPSSSFGLSVMRLGVDGIPDTRDALIDVNGNGRFDGADRIDYSRVTYFTTSDWVFYASYAKAVSSVFSYGANLKFIRRSLGDASATGVGFDVAAQYIPYDNVRLGVNIQDVTTTLVAWSTGLNELISPTIKAGGAYLVDIFGGRFAPEIDFDVRFENRRTAATTHLGPVSIDLRGGLEYTYKNVVAVRFGYTDIKQITLGAGLRLPKLDVDYSFAKFDGTGQLGNTHRISLKLTIDSDKYARPTE